MAKTTLKLNLVMAGYSPDKIGLFTAILNRQLKLSEGKVRELLGMPFDLVSETIESLNDVDTYERQVFKQSANRLDKAFPDSGVPDLKYVVMAVTQAAVQIGLELDQQRIVDLAEFIMKNWAELKMTTGSDGERGLGAEGETPETQAWFDRAAQVPQIQKQPLG